ncbi:MAG: pseudouridine synthase [Calditrichota bacterium]
MRLNHFLAQAGAASRRSSETLIRAGRVRVNDRIVADPAFTVSEADRIQVDGEPLALSATRDFTYIMLHKPVGVISAMIPSRVQEPCLKDLVQVPERIFPVGRLDQDSCGLILLTNDGELAFRLTHPRFHVSKEYLVRVNRVIHPREWEKLARGAVIDDRPVQVEEIIAVSQNQLRIVLHEGRKHIVRRLMGALGFHVTELKRTRIGSLHLGKLGRGRWRKLKPNEIKLLKDVCGEANQVR